MPGSITTLDRLASATMADLEAHHHKLAQRVAIVEALHRRLQARTELGPFVTLFAKTQPYLMGWFHRELCELLTAFMCAVEQKRSPRLMIFAPPRAGKSEPTSRCFPPFVLGNHPEWEIIAATYNQDFANDWGRDVRAIFENPLYRELFPHFEIRKDSNAVDHVRTTMNGSYTTVGKGGSLTGRGCHILLIDDPLKDRAEADSEVERTNLIKWYESTARTRLAPGGGIIIIQTRWHEMDLAGYLLEKARDNPNADQWMVYSYPAIAVQDEKYRKAGEALHPERWPLDELLKIKASIDPREWSALYQQNPVPAEGIMFKSEWFKFAAPQNPRDMSWYITTDFAIGEKTYNDYTCLWPFAVSANDDIYFAQPVHGRFQAHEIVERLCDLTEQYRPREVAIENVHIGKTIGPYLKKRMQERRLYTVLHDITPVRDKVARSASLRGRMQQGKVWFHPASRADILPEFLAFPASKHDDYVDAAVLGSMLLDVLIRGHGARPPPSPAPPEWSMSWMQQRIRRHETDRHAEVFPHLNGKPRKRTEAPSWTD